MKSFVTFKLLSDGIDRDIELIVKAQVDTIE